MWFDVPSPNMSKLIQKLLRSFFAVLFYGSFSFWKYFKFYFIIARAKTHGDIFWQLIKLCNRFTRMWNKMHNQIQLWKEKRGELQLWDRLFFSFSLFFISYSLKCTNWIQMQFSCNINSVSVNFFSLQFRFGYSRREDDSWISQWFWFFRAFIKYAHTLCFQVFLE